MQNSHLLNLLSESSLSYEALGARIGVSGMSLRRWLKNSPQDSVPEPYASAFQLTIQKLVGEGTLPATSISALWAFESIGTIPFEASLRALGFDLSEVEKESHEDGLITMLNKVGSQDHVKSVVEAKSVEIEGYRKHGLQWLERIVVLTDVLKNPDLLAMDKFVALGALFYLVLPFDFIPDAIPVIGLMDDFAILGIATAYYMKRARK